MLFFRFGHFGGVGFFHGAIGEGDGLGIAVADGFAEGIREGFGDVHVGVQVVEVDFEFFVFQQLDGVGEFVVVEEIVGDVPPTPLFGETAFLLRGGLGAARAGANPATPVRFHRRIIRGFNLNHRNFTTLQILLVNFHAGERKYLAVPTIVLLLGIRHG